MPPPISGGPGDAVEETTTYSEWQRKTVQTFILNTGLGGSSKGGAGSKKKGGGGDASASFSLQELVESVPPYSRILIHSGEYRDQISITRPIEIVAAEGDEVSLCSRGPCLTIMSDVPCYFANIKIKIRHPPGTQERLSQHQHAISGMSGSGQGVEGGVPVAFMGKAAMQNAAASFAASPGTGGAASAGKSDPPAVLINAGKPVFFKCEMTSMVVCGTAAPVVERCFIAGNIGGSGLVVKDGAGGEYMYNVITDHSKFCLEVYTRGAPKFIQNDIHARHDDPSKQTGMGLARIVGSGRVAAPSSANDGALTSSSPTFASFLGAPDSSGGSMQFAEGGGAGGLDPDNVPVFDGNRFRDTFSDQQAAIGTAIIMTNILASQHHNGGGSGSTGGGASQGGQASKVGGPHVLASPIVMSNNGLGTSSALNTSSGSGGGGSSLTSLPPTRNPGDTTTNGNKSALATSRKIQIQPLSSSAAAAVVGEGGGPSPSGLHRGGGFQAPSTGSRGVVLGSDIAAQRAMVRVENAAIIFKNNSLDGGIIGLLLAGGSMASSSTPGTFTENNISNSILCGLFMGNNCNASVSHSRIQGHRAGGVFLDGCQAILEEVHVADCKGPGVSIANCSDFSIEKCVIETSKGGVVCTGHCSGLIHENSIQNNELLGIRVSGFGCAPLISNNTIAHNKSVGISAQKSATPVISGNKINRHVIAGIVSELNACPRVFSNTLSKNENYGILCDTHGKGFFTENTISESLAGFRVQNSANPEIEACLIDESTIGLDFQMGCMGRATKNTISGCSTGIHVSQYADPLVQDSMIQNCARFGILASTDGLGTFLRNTIAHCHVGISATDGAEPVFRGNSIELCNSAGGNFGPDNKAYLEKNKFVNCKGDGLILTGEKSDATVINCTFLKCGGFAIISQDKAAGEVTRCHFEENEGGGYGTRDGGDTYFARNLSIRDVGPSIICREGGKGTFESNISKDGQSCGIVLEDRSDGVFTDCIVQSAAYFGVHIKPGAVGNMSKCALVNNGKAGILCAGSVHGGKGGMMSTRATGGGATTSTVSTRAAKKDPAAAAPSDAWAAAVGGHTNDPIASSSPPGQMVFATISLHELLIQGNGEAGVVCTEGASANITNSYINNQPAGLKLHNAMSSVMVRGCSFESNDVGCAVSNNGNAQVVDCHFENSKNQHVRLFDGGHATFSQCTFGSTPRSAIFSHSKSAGLFKECLITHAVDWGVVIEDGSTTRYESCTIVECLVGVLCHNAGIGSFLKCTITRNRIHGVQLQSKASTTFDQCSIEGSYAGCGIVAEGDACVLNGGNIIAFNRQHGVAIGRSSSLIIRGTTNKIHHNRKCGVYCGEASQSHITMTDVFENVEAGIALGCRNICTISNCNIFRNNSCGVFAESGAKGKLEKCDLNDNFVANVRLSGGAMSSVTHCRIHAGRYCGIAVEGGSAGLIAHNDIFNHQDSCGVYIVGASDTRLETNTFRENNVGVKFEQNGKNILAFQPDLEAPILVDIPVTSEREVSRGAHKMRSNSILSLGAAGMSSSLTCLPPSISPLQIQAPAPTTSKSSTTPASVGGPNVTPPPTFKGGSKKGAKKSSGKVVTPTSTPATPSTKQTPPLPLDSALLSASMEGANSSMDGTVSGTVFKRNRLHYQHLFECAVNEVIAVANEFIKRQRSVGGGGGGGGALHRGASMDRMSRSPSHSKKNSPRASHPPPPRRFMASPEASPSSSSLRDPSANTTQQSCRSLLERVQRAEFDATISATSIKHNGAHHTRVGARGGRGGEEVPAVLTEGIRTFRLAALMADSAKLHRDPNERDEDDASPLLEQTTTSMGSFVFASPSCSPLRGGTQAAIPPSFNPLSLRGEGAVVGEEMLHAEGSIEYAVPSFLNTEAISYLSTQQLHKGQLVSCVGPMLLTVSDDDDISQKSKFGPPRPKNPTALGVFGANKNHRASTTSPPVPAAVDNLQPTSFAQHHRENTHLTVHVGSIKASRDAAKTIILHSGEILLCSATNGQLEAALSSDEAHLIYLSMSRDASFHDINSKFNNNNEHPYAAGTKKTVTMSNNNNNNNNSTSNNGAPVLISATTSLMNVRQTQAELVDGGVGANKKGGGLKRSSLLIPGGDRKMSSSLTSAVLRVGDCSSAILVHNSFKSHTLCGMLLSTNSNAVASKNTFEGESVGCRIEFGAVGEITECIFTECSRGIALNGYGIGTSITNNVFLRNKIGVYCKGNTTTSHSQPSIMYASKSPHHTSASISSTTTATAVSVPQQLIVQSAQTVISANTFRDSQLYSIYTSHQSTTRITGNTFEADICVGVAGVTGSAAVVIKNVFRNGSAVGVQATPSTSLIIEENQFEAIHVGLLATGGVTNVTRNVFTGCKIAGVISEGDSTTVECSRNLFAFCKQHELSCGILTRGGGGGNFAENDMHENSIGVRSEHGGMGTFHHCFLHDNSKFGLYATSGATPSFSYCNFSSNGRGDVCAEYSGKPSVTRSSFLDCSIPIIIRNNGGGHYTQNLIRDVAEGKPAISINFSKVIPSQPLSSSALFLYGFQGVYVSAPEEGLGEFDIVQRMESSMEQSGKIDDEDLLEMSGNKSVNRGSSSGNMISITNNARSASSSSNKQPRTPSSASLAFNAFSIKALAMQIHNPFALAHTNGLQKGTTVVTGVSRMKRTASFAFEERDQANSTSTSTSKSPSKANHLQSNFGPSCTATFEKNLISACTVAFDVNCGAPPLTGKESSNTPVDTPAGTRNSSAKGVGSSPGVAPGGGLSIQGNSATTTTSDTLPELGDVHYTSSALGAKITENFIINCPTGIIVYNSSTLDDGANIPNELLSTTNAHVTSSVCNVAPTYRSDTLEGISTLPVAIFTGNTILNADAGIWLRNGGHARFEGNWIAKPTKVGIFVVEGSRGEFYQNVVTDGSQHGVLIQATSEKFMVNPMITVGGPAAIGAANTIFEAHYKDNIVYNYTNFQENIIANCTRMGLGLTTAGARLTKNRITHNELGCFIGPYSTGVFAHNIVQDSKRVGTFYCTLHMQLTGNTFYSPTDHGAFEARGEGVRAPMGNTIKNQFSLRVNKDYPTSRIQGPFLGREDVVPKNEKEKAQVISDSESMEFQGTTSRFLSIEQRVSSADSSKTSEMKLLTEMKNLLDALKHLHEECLPMCGSLGCKRLGIVQVSRLEDVFEDSEEEDDTIRRQETDLNSIAEALTSLSTSKSKIANGNKSMASPLRQQRTSVLAASKTQLFTPASKPAAAPVVLASSKTIAADPRKRSPKTQTPIAKSKPDNVNFKPQTRVSLTTESNSNVPSVAKRRSQVQVSRPLVPPATAATPHRQSLAASVPDTSASIKSTPKRTPSSTKQTGSRKPPSASPTRTQDDVNDSPIGNLRRRRTYDDSGDDVEVSPSPENKTTFMKHGGGSALDSKFTYVSDSYGSINLESSSMVGLHSQSSRFRFDGKPLSDALSSSLGNLLASGAGVDPNSTPAGRAALKALISADSAFGEDLSPPGEADGDNNYNNTYNRQKYPDFHARYMEPVGWHRNIPEPTRHHKSKSQNPDGGGESSSDDEQDGMMSMRSPTSLKQNASPKQQQSGSYTLAPRVYILPDGSYTTNAASAAAYVSSGTFDSTAGASISSPRSTSSPRQHPQHSSPRLNHLQFGSPISSDMIPPPGAVVGKQFVTNHRLAQNVATNKHQMVAASIGRGDDTTPSTLPPSHATVQSAIPSSALMVVNSYSEYVGPSSPIVTSSYRGAHRTNKVGVKVLDINQHLHINSPSSTPPDLLTPHPPHNNSSKRLRDTTSTLLESNDMGMSYLSGLAVVPTAYHPSKGHPFTTPHIPQVSFSPRSPQLPSSKHQHRQYPQGRGITAPSTSTPSSSHVQTLELDVENSCRSNEQRKHHHHHHPSHLPSQNAHGNKPQHQQQPRQPRTSTSPNGTTIYEVDGEADDGDDGGNDINVDADDEHQNHEQGQVETTSSEDEGDYYYERPSSSSARATPQAAYYVPEGMMIAGYSAQTGPILVPVGTATHDADGESDEDLEPSHSSEMKEGEDDINTISNTTSSDDEDDFEEGGFYVVDEAKDALKESKKAERDRRRRVQERVLRKRVAREQFQQYHNQQQQQHPSSPACSKPRNHSVDACTSSEYVKSSTSAAHHHDTTIVHPQHPSSTSHTSLQFLNDGDCGSKGTTHITKSSNQKQSTVPPTRQYGNLLPSAPQQQHLKPSVSSSTGATGASGTLSSSDAAFSGLGAEDTLYADLVGRLLKLEESDTRLLIPREEKARTGIFGSGGGNGNVNGKNRVSPSRSKGGSRSPDGGGQGSTHPSANKYANVKSKVDTFHKVQNASEVAGNVGAHSHFSGHTGYYNNNQGYYGGAGEGYGFYGGGYALLPQAMAMAQLEKIRNHKNNRIDYYVNPSQGVVVTQHGNIRTHYDISPLNTLLANQTTKASLMPSTPSTGNPKDASTVTAAGIKASRKQLALEQLLIKPGEEELLVLQRDPYQTHNPTILMEDGEAFHRQESAPSTSQNQQHQRFNPSSSQNPTRRVIQVIKAPANSQWSNVSRIPPHLRPRTRAGPGGYILTQIELEGLLTEVGVEIVPDPEYEDLSEEMNGEQDHQPGLTAAVSTSIRSATTTIAPKLPTNPASSSAATVAKLSTRTKTLLKGGASLSVVTSSQADVSGMLSGVSTVLDSRLATSVLQAELRNRGQASALTGGGKSNSTYDPRLPHLTASGQKKPSRPTAPASAPSSGTASGGPQEGIVGGSPFLPAITCANSNGVSTSRFQWQQASAAAASAATPASEGLFTRKGITTITTASALSSRQQQQQQRPPTSGGEWASAQ